MNSLLLHLLSGAVLMAIGLDALRRPSRGGLHVWAGLTGLVGGALPVVVAWLMLEPSGPLLVVRLLLLRGTVSVLSALMVGVGVSLALGPGRRLPIFVAVAWAAASLVGAGLIFDGLEPAQAFAGSLGAGIESPAILLHSAVSMGGGTLALFGGATWGLLRARSPFVRNRLTGVVATMAITAVIFLWARFELPPERFVGLASLLLVAAAMAISRALSRFRLGGPPDEAYMALYRVTSSPALILDLAADRVVANPAAVSAIGGAPDETPDHLVRRLGLAPDAETFCMRLGGRDASGPWDVSLGGRRFEARCACDVRNGVGFVILSDVTAWAHSQAELSQALADLEETQSRMMVQEKMAALGSLISGISHEINNPIAYVASNLRALREYFGELAEGIDHARRLPAPEAVERLQTWATDAGLEGTLAEAKEAIEDGLDGCNRIRNIVGSMRVLSRQNESRQESDLAVLARDAVKVARTSVHPGVKLLLRLEESLPVVAVPGEISRVITNLVVNAGQALGTEGKIMVTSWREGDTGVVEVVDDGPGIPPEIQTRIFEPFFTTKPAGQGTGLGLAISYQTLREHGGDLRVYSTPGEGARFQVRLPLLREDLPSLPDLVTLDPAHLPSA